MDLNKWKNYGDVNPIEHGGVFVKHDRKRCYYVVSLQPLDLGWAFIDGYIDLDDSWIEWNSVKETCDTPENAEDEVLAVDCMWYYGSNLSDGKLEVLHEEQEVIDRLTAMEIPTEWES